MKRTLTIIAGLALIAGVVATSLRHLATQPTGETHAARIAFYQDSMHPWIKSPNPGRCTLCGMDLTPIPEGHEGFTLAADTVVLAPNSVTALNVQAETVATRPIVRTLRVAGTLEPNEARRNIVSAPAIGRVENLFVEYAGLEVTEGSPLMTFYSPTWANQSRRLSFLNRVVTTKGDSAASASEMEMAGNPSGPMVHPGGMSSGMPGDGKTKPGSNFYTDLLAPQSGIVLERFVSRGQYVQEGDKLFTIVDAAMVWFRFDVYEQQLPWLEAGQTIEVSTPSVPGKVFSATISFIEPSINEATRTVRVRADILNPLVEVGGRRQRLLRYGMYADGSVQSSSASALLIPRDAVLLPGGDAYAFRENGPGVYERCRVKLGRQGDHHWEVLDGLKEGDRVVTSGNVLIDAQSQFNRPRGEVSPASQHDSAPLPRMPMQTMTMNHPMTTAASNAKEPLCGLMSNLAARTTIQPASNTVTSTLAVNQTRDARPPATNGVRNKSASDRMGQAFATRMKQVRRDDSTNREIQP